MWQYWAAVLRRLPEAAADVLVVAAVSLAPLLFGRLILVIGPARSSEPYWAFLTNGQMAFFSMGTLAALLLMCLRKKLPDMANLAFGTFTVFALLFIMVLVGVDPTLKAGSFQFVGKAVLFVYVAALITRILAEAMKGVSSNDALAAGSALSRRIADELGKRKAGDKQ